MIKKTNEQDGKVRATFVLPYADGQAAVSVVGDFNGWDPAANKLVRRKNGTRSTSVVLSPAPAIASVTSTPTASGSMTTRQMPSSWVNTGARTACWSCSHLSPIHRDFRESLRGNLR